MFLAPAALRTAFLVSRTASRCGSVTVAACLGVARGGIVLGSVFRSGALRLVLLAEAGFQPRTGLLCLVGHRPLPAPEPKGCPPSSPSRDCVEQSAKRRRHGLFTAPG